MTNGNVFEVAVIVTDYSQTSLPSTFLSLYWHSSIFLHGIVLSLDILPVSVGVSDLHLAMNFRHILSLGWRSILRIPDSISYSSMNFCMILRENSLFYSTCIPRLGQLHFQLSLFYFELVSARCTANKI